MMTFIAWWVVEPAAGFCESTIIVDYYGPNDVLVWPEWSESAAPDTILVVHRSGLGAVGALQLLDPAGVEVAATRIDLAEQWTVLVPDAPLAVGEGYQVVTESFYEANEFDVADAPEEPLEPTPVPVRRNTFSEVLRLDEGCPDEAYTVHEVDYRLCERSPLWVAVLGESEPPAPGSVADLGVPDAVGSDDQIILSEGLVADASVTVWLGSFDGVGRFQGWVADTLTMPSPGTIRLEEPVGDTISPSVTPTAFTDCPSAPVTWSATFEQTCDSWASTGLECNEDDTEEDTVSGCSCATGARSGLGGGALLAFVLAWLRRRA